MVTKSILSSTHEYPLLALEVVVQLSLEHLWCLGDSLCLSHGFEVFTTLLISTGELNSAFLVISNNEGLLL